MSGEIARRFRAWLRDKLPRPTPASERRPRLSTATHAIVFGQFPNPTYDYYLESRIRDQFNNDVTKFDVRQRTKIDLDAKGALVIICRYASDAVVSWINAHSEEISAVGVFIDDDIPAIITGREASIGYRLRLLARAIWPIPRLNRQMDFLWTSTAVLASRHEKAIVLPPRPLPEHWRNEGDRACSGVSEKLVIAYHATAVHRHEHLFVLPLVRAVLQARGHVEFEVFADPSTAYIWRNIERVTVRPQLSWEDYLIDASATHIDIMLVPLLQSDVNDCRAATKKIDVARYRAAAIYSASPAYGFPDNSGEIRLQNDPKVWQEHLLELVDDASLRARCAAATQRQVKEMARNHALTHQL
jgi:hypothetical protein